MKKVIILISVLNLNLLYGYSCTLKSCDGVLTYAMDRYKTKSLKRMDDFYKALDRVTHVSEKHENKLFLKDRNETIRLKARLIIQANQIKEIVHHSKTK